MGAERSLLCCGMSVEVTILVLLSVPQHWQSSVTILSFLLFKHPSLPTASQIQLPFACRSAGVGTLQEKWQAACCQGKPLKPVPTTSCLQRTSSPGCQVPAQTSKSECKGMCTCVCSQPMVH